MTSRAARQRLRPGASGEYAVHASKALITAIPVTLKDIQAAAAAIKDALVRTPTRHSRTLSEIAGCEVWLKF